MAVTRKYADTESSKFRDWWNQQDQETKDKYCTPEEEGPLGVYLSCWCGSKDFRDYQVGDCPNGVTISPIIWEPSDEDS